MTTRGTTVTHHAPANAHPIPAAPPAVSQSTDGTNGTGGNGASLAMLTLSPVSTVTAHDGPLTVKAYRGDSCVLIAMDLEQASCTDLAGFAIARSTDGGKTFTYTQNRLSFNPAKGVTATIDPNKQLAERDTSDAAPYQKFRWADYPPDTFTGAYTYKVEARYFVAGAASPATAATALVTKASVVFSLPLSGDVYPNFQIGFTRGYVSSQAFASRWPDVRELRPMPRSAVFSTAGIVPSTNTAPPTTWISMYRWLGARARELLNSFLETCDKQNSDYDVFAYDLDEPDFIEALVHDAKKPGRKIRMILDDAQLHTKSGALEIEAAKDLAAAGVEVKRGHFKRYAHDKCIIQHGPGGGDAIRVLTGSANFSVRGLYVQSNSVIVIEDPQIAALYGQAFDEAWNDMSTFSSSEIASQWFDASGSGIPKFSVSFAPHKNASVSLDRVASAIKNAKSSVLFAVMELGGGGDVLSELRNIQQRSDIFSYGITQTTSGLKFYKNGNADGLLVPFGFLKAHVPLPFRAEWNGGMGQVIHHKFVVVDFNDANPQVFCGSSNLAEGGEESNGDNMLAISDPAIASLYGVEAIQLVDHYEFRALMQNATNAAPLLLQGPGVNPPWWTSSYDPSSLKSRERLLFAR